MDHLDSRPKPVPKRRPPISSRPPVTQRPPVSLPPPQAEAQSVRFRPDRPRQPQLMRRLEGISTPQL